MNEKLIISIVSVVFGIVLTLLIEYFRKQRRKTTLKKALLVELDDIKDRLELVCKSYERGIQIFALNGIEPVIPLPVDNFIFEEHYAETALYLRASQRKSYQLIHGYVKSVNDGIERGSNLLLSVKENNDSSLKVWGDHISTQYQNAALTYWHVNYHLKNSEFPFLEDEGDDVHSAMIGAMNSARKHVDNLINDSRKNLKREEFK